MFGQNTLQMEKLTAVEEEVMQHIWSLGACTVSQILEKYGEDKPPHSTISSVVRILEKKNFVDHKAYGRTYEYFPIVTKMAYTKRSLKKLVADYFAGSPNELVSFLVKEEQVNPEEMEALINSFKSQKD